MAKKKESAGSAKKVNTPTAKKETQEARDKGSDPGVEQKKVDDGPIKPSEKTLTNTDAKGARKQVKDIEFFGDGDTFKLISKAASQSEGWMKSTKAMEVNRLGVVVQVTTQQRNPDGSYACAEAVTFVPGARIIENLDENGKVIGRTLAK